MLDKFQQYAIKCKWKKYMIELHRPVLLGNYHSWLTFFFVTKARLRLRPTYKTETRKEKRTLFCGFDKNFIKNGKSLDTFPLLS